MEYLRIGQLTEEDLRRLQIDWESTYQNDDGMVVLGRRTPNLGASTEGIVFQKSGFNSEAIAPGDVSKSVK